MIQKVFLSHHQIEGGDQTAGNYIRFKTAQIEAWTDQIAIEVTRETMEKGVKECDLFVLFLSPSIGKSYFTTLEIVTAIKSDKRIICLRDERHKFSNEDVLVDLLMLMMSEDELNVPAVENLNDLNAKLGMIENALTYPPKSIEDKEFLSTILGYSIDIWNFNSEAQPKFFIACKPLNGYDPAYIIQGELRLRFNVYSKIISSSEDIPTSSSYPLIVFVTDGVFEEDHVLTAINNAKRVSFVVEADLRRNGASICRDVFNGNESLWLKEEIMRIPNKKLREDCNRFAKSFSRFGKSERKSLWIGSFLENLLDSIGLITPPFPFQQNHISMSQVVTPLDAKIQLCIDEFLSAPDSADDIKARGLLIETESSSDTVSFVYKYYRNQIVATCDLSLFQQDMKGAVISLSGQMFMSLPGFRLGIPASEKESENLFAEPDLQKLAQASLVAPCFLVSQNFEKKIILINQLTNQIEFSTILRVICGNLPANYCIIVLGEKKSMTEDVARSLSDFAHVNSTHSSLKQGVTKSSYNDVTVSQSIMNEYDFFISFLTGESCDAARSLSLDLIEMRPSCKIWFDPIGGWSESRVGIQASKAIIVIATSGTNDDEVQQKEIVFAKSLNKPMIVLVEIDPLHFGLPKYNLQEDETILKRTGEQRIRQLESILAVVQLSNSFPQLKIGTFVAFTPRILICGDVHENLDALEEIRFMLANSRGVSVGILNSEEEASRYLPTANSLFVYLTKGAPSLKIVQKCISQAKEIGIPCIYSYNADKRALLAPVDPRTGNLDFSSLKIGLKTDDDHNFFASVASNEFIQHDPRSRLRGQARRDFVQKILEQSSLSSFASLTPPLYDFSNVAIEKAKEMDPGTREWLFSKVKSWMEDPGSNSVFLLIAGAGIGKSVIMGELVRRYNTGLGYALSGSVLSSSQAVVAGYHFFRSSDSSSSSGLIALLSLSSQLRSCLGSFPVISEEELEKKKKDNPPLSSWLDFLILDPVSKIEVSIERKIVLVIDALDECLDSAELCEAIKDSWERKRPKWLYLIASSRPEDLIVKSTSKFNPFILKPTLEENEEDLKIYLRRRLISWGVQDVDQVNEAIVKQSEGVFVWIRFQESAIRGLQPEITTDAIKKLPKGTKQLYQKYFQDLKMQLGNDQSLYDDTLSIGLICPRTYIPEIVWKKALGYKSSSSLAKFEKQLLGPISKLLLFEDTLFHGKRSRVLKPPHKSMIDWLVGEKTDSSSARGMGRGDLALSSFSKKSHEKIALVLDEIYNEMKVDSWLVADALDLETTYAIMNRNYHWRMSDRLEKAQGSFIEFQPLYWMISAHIDQFKSIDRAENDLHELLSSLRDSPLKLISSFLKLAEDALTKDSRQLAGQVIGRFPNQNPDSQLGKLVSGAQIWINNAVQSGHLRVCVPVQPELSGLRFVGGSLMKVFPFSFQVASVAFLRDRKHFAAGFYDCTIRIINLDSGEVVKVLDEPSRVDTPESIFALAITPDGTRMISTHGRKGLAIWDLGGYKILKILNGHSSPVKQIALSSTGEICLSAGAEKSLIIWNVRKLTMIREVKVREEEVMIACAGLSPNGVQFVVALENKKVFLCSTKKSLVPKRFRDEQILLGTHEEDVKAVAISMTHVVASSGTEIKVWSLQSKTLLQTIKEGGASHLYLSSDSATLIASNHKGDVSILNLVNGEVMRTFNGHTNGCWNFDIHEKEEEILSCSIDSTVMYWSKKLDDSVIPKTQNKRQIICHSLSQDKSIAATATADPFLFFWDARKGKMQHKISLENMLTCLRLSKNGDICVSSSSYDKVRVWDVKTGTLQSELENQIHKMYISPDAKYLVEPGGFHAYAYVYNLQEGKLVFELKKPNSKGFNIVTYKSTTISKDGKYCKLVMTTGQGKEETYFIDLVEKLDQASVPANTIFLDVNKQAKFYDDDGNVDQISNGFRFCSEGDIGMTFDHFSENGSDSLCTLEEIVYGNRSNYFILWKIRSL